MTYGHLQTDCLYIGISSGPNARYRVWEAFTFFKYAKQDSTHVRVTTAALDWQSRRFRVLSTSAVKRVNPSQRKHARPTVNHAESSGRQIAMYTVQWQQLSNTGFAAFEIGTL